MNDRDKQDKGLGEPKHSEHKTKRVWSGGAKKERAKHTGNPKLVFSEYARPNSVCPTNNLTHFSFTVDKINLGASLERNQRQLSTVGGTIAQVEKLFQKLM